MAGQHQSPLAVLPLVFLQAFAIELFELPGTYLFRQMRCDEYRQDMGLPPDADVCRDPTVQKRYSTDLAIYMTVLSVLSIVVSGPFGTLSDRKGRKLVISTSASITLVGEVWTVLCSSLPPLRHPVFIYLAAVLKGIGGSYAVMKAAELALISENSPAETRSFFLGLVLVVSMAATAIAPLVGGALVNNGKYTLTFLVGMVAWCVHLAYTLAVLQEPPHSPLNEDAGDADTETADRQSTAAITPSSPRASSRARATQTLLARTRHLLQLIINPLLKLAADPTLRLLAIVVFLMSFGTAAFIILIPWSDARFGLPPAQAGMINATMATSRALSVLCILPLVKYAFRRFVERRRGIRLEGGGVGEDGEPLMEPEGEGEGGEEEQQEPPEVTPNPALRYSVDALERSMEANLKKVEAKMEAQRLSAAQELWICRISFFLDMLGMLLVSASQSPVQVAISVAIGALGAPAIPSVQSLVTMVTPDADLGQVLAALTIVEGVVLSIRNPVLFGVYNATLGTADAAVWWTAAVLLAACGVVASFLRPSRFVTARAMDYVPI